MSTEFTIGLRELRAVARACEKTENKRPMMEYVWIKQDEKGMTCFATDGFMIADLFWPADEDDEAVEFGWTGVHGKTILARKASAGKEVTIKTDEARGEIHAYDGISFFDPSQMTLADHIIEFAIKLRAMPEEVGPSGAITFDMMKRVPQIQNELKWAQDTCWDMSSMPHDGNGGRVFKFRSSNRRHYEPKIELYIMQANYIS